MKKLLTLFVLLVAIVTGAWAADEVVIIGSKSSAFTIDGTSHAVAGLSSGTNSATITAASDGQTASAGSKMNVTTNIGSKLSGKAHIRFTVVAGETVRLYVYWGSNSKSATFRTSDYSQDSDYLHEGKLVSSASKNTLQFVDFTFENAGTYAISAVSGDNPYMAAIKFTAPATKHKVEYNLGAGTSATGAPSQADVAEKAKFTVAAAPTDLVPPTGKEFKCWNDGTTDYAPGDEYTMGTSDVTLTAQYQNETVKYAVSYAAGEGTGSMDGTEKAEGAVFNLPASTFTVPEGKVFANWLCNVDGETYAAGAPYTMTATATTFTAQYVAVAPKIIYSLVDGIGSAEKTANDATVTDGTSLVLTNSAGRITITAVTGDTFKNGDAIAFSGTIGNTARDYGIKYGASEANTNLYVAAGQPCSVSGTLSLSSNSSTLVMGRYAASTTTMTDFVISRTVGVSSESLGNVIINGVSATEGTDYTVSGNTITLSKTYLVCPVVRIVGNATFADETTGKTSHAVTFALDEDTYTGTATVAGTTYTVNAPYKAGESIDLSSTEGYSRGFSGYCAPENFTVTGGTAYAAKIVDSKIVLTAYETDYVPKNTGVIIAGDKGASVTIAYTATTTPGQAFPDNDLKGTTVRTLTSTLKGSAAKFITLQKSTSKFVPYTGEYFPANRAYLLYNGASGDSFDIVFDGETAINSIEANENANSAAPVKVIKNGKLYIGNYNVAGQQVK